ncbi:hypothetical protein QWZ04_11820 [Vibrio tapetis subsp. quintayensis]|uniref:hypothetical protein n=1 Tax=Vibrio tapetis TaxID=52443 RepID=UPI0025B5D9FF|nr:hypothetical protein [Vibrio tapetis]MDN3681010.1 hypothetical protein [Vibrio tapetis subsp. quintayensis]
MNKAPRTLPIHIAIVISVLVVMVSGVQIWLANKVICSSQTGTSLSDFPIPGGLSV